MDASRPELLACPSCRQAMAALCLEARPLGHLTLDFCVGCRGIWFDPHESNQLAPASVLELFKVISTARAEEAQPIAARLACPRCKQALLLTHDVVRSGRFAYHRCPSDHGRFTPFAQFLTEKGFVRHLGKAEIEQVAVGIGQIACHACGGPIDLKRDTACPHCRSPIAVLDAEAMSKAFKFYGAAAAPRLREVTGDLFVSARSMPLLPQHRGTSLLELGIGAVADLFD